MPLSLDLLSQAGLQSSWWIAMGLNTVLAAIAVVAPKKLLTPMGLLHAWFLGVVILGILGWSGYAVVMFYFLVGSGVTRVGLAEKEAAGIAEKRSGARGPENVWGSALTGLLCALGIGLIGLAQWSSAPWSSAPWASWLALAYVASFSTKLSDTCASEIGKAYGKHTFLITTLKPVPAGTEGAISLEGTLAGVIGSAAIAIVGFVTGLIGAWGMLICVIAAFVGTNVESLIGATLQEQWDWLTNEMVNFLNTLIGAVVAVLVAALMRGI